MRKDIEYLSKFRKSFDLKDLFYYISFHAWERLELYSKVSSKVGEEELTNILVSEILSALCRERVQLPIRFFHSKKESLNGNDLEIVIPLSNGKYIIMPCQAKRLYVETARNNNLLAQYTAIHHPLNRKTPNEKEQICYLLEYAQRVEGFPLYLFYNYTEHQVAISPKYPKKELYGCTLASAYHVFEGYYANKKMSPFKFQDIHPPAKPFISLLDKGLLTQLNTIFGVSTNFNKSDPKHYTEVELLRESWWDEKCPPLSVPISRRGATQTLEDMLKNKNSSITEEHPFNPKYRIMILNEPEIHRKPNIEQ